MRNVDKLDVDCLEIVCTGWRSNSRLYTVLNGIKVYRDNATNKRYIRFKSPQNRQKARLLADRLESLPTVKRINCIVRNGGFI